MALSRKARETVNTVEKLLGGVDGVSWRWDNSRRKHMRLYLTVGQETFFITMSVTASDARARLNQVGDVKRELRKRGVEL